MILLESIDSRILVQVFRRICRDHRNHLLLSFNEESRFLFRETDTVEKETLPIEIRTVLSRKTFASLFSSFIRPVWIIRLPLWRVVESRLLEHSRGRRGRIGSIDPDRRRSFLNNQNPEEHIESALVAVTNFSSFFFCLESHRLITPSNFDSFARFSSPFAHSNDRNLGLGQTTLRSVLSRSE